MNIQRRHLNERTYKPKLKNIMDNIETNMRLYFDENDKFDAGDEIILSFQGTNNKVTCPVWTIQRLK